MTRATISQLSLRAAPAATVSYYYIREAETD
jgi:hypothetical protein